MGNLGVGAREVDGQHGQSAQDRPQGWSRVWGVRRNKPPEWMTVKPKTPSSTRRLPPGGVGGCSGSSLFCPASSLLGSDRVGRHVHLRRVLLDRHVATNTAYLGP